MKDKHTEAFIQESFELLEVLESSLLQLEEKPDDEELIGKIFRSLHTIKGSSGMFGFGTVAEFIHDIETVYDLIRGGKLRTTNEIIDLTLKAADHISVMIKGGKNYSTAGDDVYKEITNRFKEFLPKTKTEKKKKTAAPEEKNKKGKFVYHIFFEPQEDLFLKGTKPVGLLTELSGLGSCLLIPDLSKIPLLNEINPEKLYISWNIILSTDKGYNSIKDVFIFVEDDCRVIIEEIGKGELKGGIEYYTEYAGYRMPDAGGNLETTGSLNQNPKPAKEKPVKDESKSITAKENISSIRVSSGKLDLLVNLVGELVTAQARLSEIAGKNKIIELDSISEDVERLTWELRENALSIRMLPIGSTFNKFNRLVRDLSKDLKKEVELITEGGDTELDKNVIEKLNDPLVHIIRNCIDHGIETPDERIKKNKLSSGSIFLSAVHSGTHVLIIISDDGKGLNKEKIYAKAVEKGFIAQGANLSEKEIYHLIFKPGFSTAKEVTNVSGRGVGLDVVKTAIESLRGSVDIESKEGSGTTITLKLPLTLAIIESMIVRIDKDFFAIPLPFVEECIELTKEAKKKLNGRNLLNVRGEIVPFIPLRDMFGIPENLPEIEQVIIVKENEMKAGLVVDEIIGQHQTVIKTLGSYYKNVDAMSGATVLGNGTVALIIDVKKLLENTEAEEKLISAKAV